ncbi:cytochrome oxidase assembly protein 1 [Emydomyces testavorans]|uniref:Cytochrome oxidase assembly protein 1 n=1 Tax=Emydomyces testavorans TaxID=2070801 RepID=A0AAF0DBQ1_9EURO|nr:cytochrome oxidase assembly protein 1 [Emydomyces testavorans]
MNCIGSLRSGRLSKLAHIRCHALASRRTLIAAPGPNTGPLLTRRADRELPSIQSHRRWIRTIPIFVVVIGASMLALFNYQKSSSSIVSSTMYALRTSPTARQILGDEIYFAQKIPWISGEMNQLHGRIDISFWVKGTRAKGKMRFKSTRAHRMGFFRTEDWSLEMEDGSVIQLLNATEGDPFQQSIGTPAGNQRATVST